MQNYGSSGVSENLPWFFKRKEGFGHVEHFNYYLITTVSMHAHKYLYLYEQTIDFNGNLHPSES